MRALPTAAALALALAGPAWAGGTLRYGIDADLDTFDPARSQSASERVVSTVMCDGLLELDAAGNAVPGLAAAWEWSPDRFSLTLRLRPGVVFQDGAKLDAAAVRANLARSIAAPFSARRGELAAIMAMDVVDPLTLTLRLRRRFTPILAALAGRAGTMLSPRMLGLPQAELDAHPVCAGPFAFVERVAGDHITLQRFAGYWNAAAVSLDRIEFRVVRDGTVRRTALQAGDLDVAARLAPVDVAVVEGNPQLRVAQSPALAFAMLSFNVANGEAAHTPFGLDVRVRQAFLKSIDFGRLNELAFDGRFIPGIQTEAPGTQFYDEAYPVPRRDLDGARGLLVAAGEAQPQLKLGVIGGSIDTGVGEALQSMAADAGFEVTLVKGNGSALTAAAAHGDYQALLLTWGGWPDPDGDIGPWMRCGSPLNWTGYCNPALGDALDRGAAQVDPAARAAAYHLANTLWMDDLPYLPLYHLRWLWGVSARVTGFVPRPDGAVRPVGLGLKP